MVAVMTLESYITLSYAIVIIVVVIAIVGVCGVGGVFCLCTGTPALRYGHTM